MTFSDLTRYMDLKACSYAPNFVEAEEAYWFGPVLVCLDHTLHAVKNRILKFDMWT